MNPQKLPEKANHLNPSTPTKEEPLLELKPPWQYDREALKRRYVHPESFLPYYRALSRFEGTVFLNDLDFNCPTAKNFLAAVQPAQRPEQESSPVQTPMD